MKNNLYSLKIFFIVNSIYMNKYLKGLKKNFDGSHLLVILGVVVLLVAMYQYSSMKKTNKDTYPSQPLSPYVIQEDLVPTDGLPRPSTGDLRNVYATVADSSSAPPLANSCNPLDLLPKKVGGTNELSTLSPLGEGVLKNKDFLSVRHGIQTTTLRNANQQLRADPVTPMTHTGPWNQTTMESGDIVNKNNIIVGL